MSNKHSRVDSQLESVSSKQSQLAELANRLQGIQLANIELKRHKISLAANERNLILKKEMEERAYVHQKETEEREFARKKELDDRAFAQSIRMKQFEYAIARLNAGHPVVASGAHPVGAGQGTHSETTYSSSMNIPQEPFTFDTDVTGVYASADWALPEASSSRS